VVLIDIETHLREVGVYSNRSEERNGETFLGLVLTARQRMGVVAL